MKPFLMAVLVLVGGMASQAAETTTTPPVDPALLQLLIPTSPKQSVTTTLPPQKLTVKTFAARVIEPRAGDERMVHQPTTNRPFSLRVVRPPGQP